MPHCDRTKQDVAGRVGDMFRLAERDHDLDLRRLARLSKLDYGSLKNYRNGTAIPFHAMIQLAPHIPDDLLSLCWEGVEKCVRSIDGGDDLDALATDAGDYAHEYAKARHPASPGGVAIVPQEAATLHDIRRRVTARAGA